MPFIVSDMDGTLSTVETWRGVHTWIKANHPSPAARRFVVTQLPFIVLARSGLYEGEAFRARWLRNHARLLRGVSEAGLAAMAEWVVEHHLWPARRMRAIEALEKALTDARLVDPSTRAILASGAYLPICEAFAARAGIDSAIGTSLEIEGGLATGRLASEVQTGPLKARAILERVGDEPVLVAFGDTEADIPMLELARRPVAVAPDGGLRRTAVDRGWELLEG